MGGAAIAQKSRKLHATKAKIEYRLFLNLSQAFGLGFL